MRDEKQNLSLTNSCPKWQQLPRLCQDQVRSAEPHLGLLYEEHRANLFSHLPLLSQVNQQRTGLRVEQLGLELAIKRCWHHKRCFSWLHCSTGPQVLYFRGILDFGIEGQGFYYCIILIIFHSMMKYYEENSPLIIQPTS